jgi:hypothetical protein
VWSLAAKHNYIFVNTPKGARGMSGGFKDDYYCAKCGSQTVAACYVRCRLGNNVEGISAEKKRDALASKWFTKTTYWKLGQNGFEVAFRDGWNARETEYRNSIKSQGGGVDEISKLRSQVSMLKGVLSDFMDRDKIEALLTSKDSV